MAGSEMAARMPSTTIMATATTPSMMPTVMQELLGGGCGIGTGSCCGGGAPPESATAGSFKLWTFLLSLSVPLWNILLICCSLLPALGKKSLIQTQSFARTDDRSIRTNYLESFSTKDKNSFAREHSQYSGSISARASRNHCWAGHLLSIRRNSTWPSM